MDTQPVSLIVPESNPYKRQGKILKMARIAQGKSLLELATEVGVCTRTLQRWENGDSVVDGVMLGRLIEVLKQDAKVFWS